LRVLSVNNTTYFVELKKGGLAMTQTEDLVNWSYGQKCEKAVGSLVRNGFTANFCPTREEARSYILAEAAEAVSVGFGGSLSVMDLDVAGNLKDMGKELLMHSAPGLTPEERRKIMRFQLTCDLFLTEPTPLPFQAALLILMPPATGSVPCSSVRRR
jgi:hypothetical protein